MKIKQNIMAITLAALAFNAHANTVNDIDSTVQAAYKCQAQDLKGKKFAMTLNVMYGIKNGEAVVAQAKMPDGTLSPGLWRDMSQTDSNVFVSNGQDNTMWTTQSANGNNINRVDGNILSVQQNGKQSVVLDQCKLDPSATKKLNR